MIFLLDTPFSQPGPQAQVEEIEATDAETNEIKSINDKQPLWGHNLENKSVILKAKDQDCICAFQKSGKVTITGKIGKFSKKDP